MTLEKRDGFLFEKAVRSPRDTVIPAEVHPLCIEVILPVSPLVVGMFPLVKSLLLVCYDPDAPGGVFYHWAAYDIAADVKQLDEIPAGKEDGRFLQAVNDFGKAGYGGPCPPRETSRTPTVSG